MGLAPTDIASAYALVGGAAGGTVAIVNPYDTPSLESDLATYRSTFGLSPCTTANGCFRKVDQNGGASFPSVDARWSLETSLDVQSVSASCPACKILVVETANAGTASLGTGVNLAVSLGAQAVSMSWGIRENIDASFYSTQYFTHPGVPLVAATGDSGYPQATVPATMPNVIAVGGTTLSRTATSATAVPRGITAANGDVSIAAALTPAQEHTAALAHAKAGLARAQTKAAAAARAVIAARKAAVTQKRLLAKAYSTRAAAMKKAKRSHTAATKHALTAARKAYSTRRKSSRIASARVVSRSRALTIANSTVRTSTSVVASAKAVVDADNRVPATTPPVTVPSPLPVITAPTQTGSPTAPVTSAPTPVAVVTPTAPPVAVTTPSSPVTSSPVTTSPSTPVVTPTPEAPTTPVRTNTSPTAGFGYTKTGLTVALDASNSSDTDGSIASYAWDFGDGTTAAGRTTSHTFAATGSYVVTLTVIDDEGASTSTYATVAVTAPAAPASPSAARDGWTETAWIDGGSGCSTYIDKPAWQTDTACSMRTVADIAAVGDANTGLAVYDTAAIAQGYTTDGWLVIGGTSLATPLIAGMLVRSGHAADYDDASPFYAHRSAFWDVTSGSNGSCSGSAVCTAGPGYDGPTGIGTPKSLASF